MSISEKTSPLKFACLSATQSISIAEDLIQGATDPSVIDEFDAPTIIRSLQALRHKAMISDNVERQKRCESLISELNFKNQSRPSSSLSNRKKPRKFSSRQASIKGDSFSNHSSLPPDDSSIISIELTDEEFEKMNPIVDALLEGCEIESIDHDAILQLKYVLKQRKKLYIDEGNYLLVKKIDEQLLNLTRINQGYVNSATLHSIKNVKKNNNLINEAQDKLMRTEKTIENYKVKLEEELNKIDESQEEAKTKIFKEIEDDAKQLEEEATEIDLGFNFKPSSDLLDMRSLERKYVINSRYEEAAELRKGADKLEAEERKAYDQTARAAIGKKEQKKKIIHEQKSKKCDDYFKNIKEKTIKKYNKLIEVSQREAEAVRERIKKLQSVHMDEKNVSSINDISDNNINTNSNYEENNFSNEISSFIDDSNINNENLDESFPQNFINEEEDSQEVMTEQEFKEHEKHIYTEFNSRLPDSSTSPIVDVTEPIISDSNNQTTPVTRKKKIIKKVVPKKNNDSNIKNNETFSDLKIDASNFVQVDNEVENEKAQNDLNSENVTSNISDNNNLDNQTKPQAKSKRTKKVVKKIVKKVPKKSS